MKSVKTVFCFILFLMFVFCTYSIAEGKKSTNNDYDILYRANQAYKKGDFETAKKGYEELLLKPGIGGDIFYNLGNCYVRLGNFGKAVLNYERAKCIMGSNADLDFNLQYIRNKIEAEQNRETFSFFQWLYNFSMAEVLLPFIIINFLFWTVFILRLWIRVEWSYYLLISLCFFWFFSGVCAGSKWYLISYDKRVVVTAAETFVHAGPSAKDTTIFSLAEGAVVKYENREGEWLLIRINEEKRGWVHNKDAERVLLSQ